MGSSENAPKIVLLLSAMLLLIIFTLGMTVNSFQLSLAQGPDSTEELGATEEPAATAEPGNGSEMDPLVERGKYLVFAVAACQDCHLTDGDYSVISSDDMEVELAGGLEFAYEPWGTVVAPNLTTLGEWTDEQIENAIRYGQRSDGSPALPPMPYRAYAGMSDDDMAAIIAYLRSLEPVENEIAEAVINEGSREDVRTVPEFDPAMEYPAPDTTDVVSYGMYLVSHVAACGRCHGSTTADGQLDPTGPLVADVVINSEFGPFNAPALVQSQLGNWSDDQLRTLIHEGIKPDGQGVFLMPVYAFHFITDADLEAIIAYLRTQP